MRMFQSYNVIRSLNPMTHLPFSLHHFDLFLSVTSARCLMKVPLPSSSGVLRGPMFLRSEATLVKKDLLVHSNSESFQWSHAPQIFQSLGVASAFSISAFSPSLLWPLMGLASGPELQVRYGASP